MSTAKTTTITVSLKVEALIFRFNSPEIHECDSVEDAVSFMKYGEDDGQCSGVGVLVDGRPVLWTAAHEPREPTEEDTASMLRYYRDAQSRADEIDARWRARVHDLESSAPQLDPLAQNPLSTRSDIS